MHKHWRIITKIKDKQKSATNVKMKHEIALYGKLPPMPLLVRITRIGPRRLDDDNLASSCKFVRDQIATIIGIDDGSSQYTWMYDQRINKVYGVDVEIVSR